MSDSIRMDIYEFLARHFPGSTLDDGYFFVQIEGSTTRRVRRERANEVLEKLCREPSWLVTVNNDPHGSVSPVRIEQRMTNYNPDWNYNEPIPQWLAELPAMPRIDLDALRRQSKPLGALAIISPSHCIVFDIHYMRLHAASQEDLERFARGSEDYFSDEP